MPTYDEIVLYRLMINVIKDFYCLWFFFFVIDFCSLETNECYQLLLLSVLHLKMASIKLQYVGLMCVFK